MMKKTMTVLLILGLAFSTMLFATSCAKKQIKGETAVIPETKPAPMEPAKGEMKEEKPMMAEEETDAERMAREAREAKLKIEMTAFEMDKIYFDFDKSELKPEARATLTKKADWLKANPNFSLIIEGHCDERGTNEYNLALGERRANAAWKFLNDLGVSGERMTTVSYGEERPDYMGHNEKAWAKNRRDEFKLKR